MTSSAVTLVCLTLALAAVGVQAQFELSSLTRNLRNQLTSDEDAVQRLVDVVHFKGPEFEKCSTKLIGAKDQAYAAAHAGMDVCRVKAAASWLSPPCLTKDIACRNRIAATKMETLKEARRCMLWSVYGPNHVVQQLKADIAECDKRSAKEFPALLPQRRGNSVNGNGNGNGGGNGNGNANGNTFNWKASLFG